MDVNLSVEFIALFTIVNPIGNIPLFLALTCDQTPQEQKRTALVASAAVMITLLVTLFSGETLLKLFGININAFRLAGMAVVASLAWSMLKANTSQLQQSPAENQEVVEKDSIAIVPLAIPLLAGAASISLVINFAAEVDGLADMIKGVVIVVLVSIATALTLLAAPGVQRVLGISGMKILTRIFGLLLLSIALGESAEALKELFPALGA
jgi:multiple antibiotic resistance protein